MDYELTENWWVTSCFFLPDMVMIIGNCRNTCWDAWMDLQRLQQLSHSFIYLSDIKALKLRCTHGCSPLINKWLAFFINGSLKICHLSLWRDSLRKWKKNAIMQMWPQLSLANFATCNRSRQLKCTCIHERVTHILDGNSKKGTSEGTDCG